MLTISIFFDTVVLTIKGEVQMHKLVVTIAHKTFETLGRIISINPQVIPRIGDRIDMSTLNTAPKVADVVWNYDNPNQTNVYVWVD
jgi:hypothetical protein